MTFTRALATNNYGPAKFIVDGTTVANGTHSTIAAALTSASSGDTIFIRPGTYTENLTLKAGVNLTAYVADASLNATGHVIIKGNSTLSTAGSVSISGIQLETNGAALLTVSGSVASIVNLYNCYLNCTNATGITFSSSSASAAITLDCCAGNLGTTGIALFAHSSAGTMRMNWCDFTNTGGSTTASTLSAGTFNPSYVTLPSPLTTSSTGLLQAGYTTFNGANVTALTHGGSVASSCGHCQAGSGSASAISISSTLQYLNGTVFSNNTNVITGAGTLTFDNVGCIGTSSGINVTTRTPQARQYGYIRSTTQPAFLSTLGSTDSNVTGAGTKYTLGSGNALTEVFDQDSNITTGGTFTAPMTGRYWLQFTITFSGLTAAMTNGTYVINTSNDDYAVGLLSAGAAMSNGNTLCVGGSVLCDMDAADTAVFEATISNGAGDTADVSPKTTGVERTYVSGFMLC
jgi:hypothetical protein